MSVDLPTILGVIGIVTAVLTAGRVVFVLEDRAAVLRDEVIELKAMAKEFNGPARNAHTELVGRVSSLEKDTAKLATTERVDALGARMEQGLSEIKAMLGRIEKDMENRI
jgi:hypothetical protein